MSMKKTVASAAPWTAASTLAGMLAQLGSIAVLARVLTQSDYGVVAASVVVLGFFQVFLGAGLSPAIIQRKNVTSRELQSVHWLNLGFASSLTIACVLSSGLVAGAFGVPRASHVVALSSLLFIVSAAGQVPQAVMEKALAFRDLAVAEMIAAVTLFAGSVAAAMVGAGAFSMAAGMLASETTRAVFYLWRARDRYRPGFHFRLRETRRFVGFGLVTTVDVMLNYWTANISAMATGRLLGSRSLGGYNLSVTLGYSMPGRINPIVTRIMFPVLASIQDDRPRVRSAYVRTVKMLGTVNAFGLGFIAAAAPVIVPVAYGPKWSWVASTAGIICLAGILRGVGFPMGPLLSALGHVKLGFAVNVIKTIIVLPASIYLTRVWGLSGAAWSMVLAQTVSIVISGWLLDRILGLPFRRYIGAIIESVVVAVPMIVGVWLASRLIDDWPSIGALFVLGAVAVLIAAGTVALLPSSTAREIREGVVKVGNRGRRGRHRRPRA